VAYPFGVIGVILGMILIRRAFRISLGEERAACEQAQASVFPAPESVSLEVANPQLDGRPLSALAGVIQAEFVVSRILRGQEVFTPVQDTPLRGGDVLLV